MEKTIDESKTQLPQCFQNENLLNYTIWNEIRIMLYMFIA